MKKPLWAKALIDHNSMLYNRPWIHHLDGWSKEVYECDDTMIRFSSNQIDLRIEIDLLNKLDLSPFLIPRYHDYVETNEGMIGLYPKIQGSRIDQEIFEKYPVNKKNQICQDLAECLSKLHNSDLPHEMNDVLLKKGHSFFSSFQTYFLNVFKDKIEDDEIQKLQDILSKINKYQSTFTPVLIHGDFTSDHWFFDSNMNLVGCIDFEDAMIFDPAYDFAGIWMSYGEKTTEEVIKHYALTLGDTWKERIKLYLMLVPYHQKLHDYLTKNT